MGSNFWRNLFQKKIFLSIRLRKNLFQKYLNLEYVEILVTGGKLIFFDIEGHSNTLSHPQLKMYFIFLDVSAIKSIIYTSSKNDIDTTDASFTLSPNKQCSTYWQHVWIFFINWIRIMVSVWVRENSNMLSRSLNIKIC